MVDAGSAGVVHGQVQGAEAPDGLGDGVLDGTRVADVTGNGESLATSLGDLVGKLPEWRLLTADEGDVGSTGSEQAGYVGTDAASGAGHERGLVGELVTVVHGLCSLSRGRPVSGGPCVWCSVPDVTSR